MRQATRPARMREQLGGGWPIGADARAAAWRGQWRAARRRDGAVEGGKRIRLRRAGLSRAPSAVCMSRASQRAAERRTPRNFCTGLG